MRTLIGALIGFASGVASGAFGIGGALLSTPGIRWLLDTPALVAVGTTLPVIIPAALTGVYTYARNKLIDVRTAVVLSTSGSVFAVLGALVTQVVPGELLLILTAALILLLSIRMLRSADGAHNGMADPSTPLLLAVGAASGFVSGLLGVGGGVILVPVLTVLLRFPVKMALGTSLAVVAAQSIPGTVTHAIIGNVDWRIVGGLIIGVVPGARLGSRAAVAASDAKLRVVVGGAMAVLAVAFAAGELRNLLA
ncbi:MAG: sulfite exporter TauE/SafE family protein [Actinomycetota bacterium]